VVGIGTNKPGSHEAGGGGRRAHARARRPSGLPGSWFELIGPLRATRPEASRCDESMAAVPATCRPLRPECRASRQRRRSARAAAAAFDALAEQDHRALGRKQHVERPSARPSGSAPQQDEMLALPSSGSGSPQCVFLGTRRTATSSQPDPAARHHGLQAWRTASGTSPRRGSAKPRFSRPDGGRTIHLVRAVSS